VPIIPGHEIVGRIDAIGSGVEGLSSVSASAFRGSATPAASVPIASVNQENLCDRPIFTGYTRDGGFATATIADARFAFPLGEAGSDVALAPLLCAGLIGWRSLVIAGDGKSWGSTALAPRPISWRRSRSGRGARCLPSRGPEMLPRRLSPGSLGATWAGGSDEMPPEPLDAAIIFATVGDLVPLALKAVRKGGRVVCAGIHMSDIPSFPYRLLWEERQLVSVANLTRQDGIDFLRLAPEIGIVTQTTTYPLNRPTKPSPISAPVGSRARRFSCHDGLARRARVAPGSPTCIIARQTRPR
jgi:propanol-preferring alcohol dehydrogenase